MEELPGRRALAGEPPEPMLIRSINRATGDERWRLVKASAVEGEPRLAVNVIEDVTEVKRAELGQRFLAEASAVLGVRARPRADAGARSPSSRCRGSPTGAA